VRSISTIFGSRVAHNAAAVSPLVAGTNILKCLSPLLRTMARLAETVFLVGGVRSWRQVWEEFSNSRAGQGYLEAVGFKDVVELTYKLRIRPWSEYSRLREIGRWNLARWEEGIEGWSLALLTTVLHVNSPLYYASNSSCLLRL
jgi:hypothetical protein